MNFELTHSSKELTEEDIVEFKNTIDQQFDCQLPNSFIELYMKYNGGIPIKSHFDDNLRSVACFFPIKYHNYNVTLETNKDRYKDSLPSESMLVFANDGIGLSYSIELREKNYGKIYLIYPDREDFDLVADSFQIFIRMLVEYNPFEDKELV